MALHLEEKIHSDQAEQLVGISNYAAQEFARIVKHLEDSGSAFVAKDFVISAEPKGLGDYNIKFTVQLDIDLLPRVSRSKT